LHPGISSINIFILLGSFLFFIGCGHSSFLLSDENSLKELNDIVKEKHVNVTVNDSIYEGDNLNIKRDYASMELNTPISFPTKELKKIKIKDISSSISRGIGYGLGGGMVAGLILGSFVGTAYNPHAQTAPMQHDENLPRWQIMSYSSILGIVTGSIGGAIEGALADNGDTIDIIYNFDDKTH